MIQLLSNPWVILVLVFFGLAVLGGTFKAGMNYGEYLTDTAYEKAEEKATDNAVNNIDNVKEKSNEVFEFIGTQNDSCDIYFNVIDRLCGPKGRGC